MPVHHLIAIYEYGDKNIEHVLSLLEYAGIGIARLYLGLKDNGIDIRHDGTHLSIRQQSYVLTDQDFANARGVLFFREKMQDLPLVTSSSDSSTDAQFSEKEWDSLIFSILIHYESTLSNLCWINPPSIYHRNRYKYALLLAAIRSGFVVPPFAVDTIFTPPCPLAVVAKAISSDELVDAEHTYSTTLLSEEFVKENLGKRSNCPSFLQKFIRAEFELRIYFLLGQCRCIKLESSEPYIDIGMVPKESLSIVSIDCPPKLIELINLFCADCHLTYCCFDILQCGQDYFLVDVTPNGSWSFYESAENFIISSWFASTLRQYLIRSSDSML